MRPPPRAAAPPPLALTGGRSPLIDEDQMDLPELRTAMEANGAAWSSFLAQDLDPDVVVVRHRDDGHPTRAGAAPRDRSSKPDLHRAHDTRGGATGDRRLGFRRAGRPARRGPPPAPHTSGASVS